MQFGVIMGSILLLFEYLFRWEIKTNDLQDLRDWAAREQRLKHWWYSIAMQRYIICEMIIRWVISAAEDSSHRSANRIIHLGCEFLLLVLDACKREALDQKKDRDKKEILAKNFDGTNGEKNNSMRYQSSDPRSVRCYR